jgi:RNA polymerase sigma-70 factor (ECF subfamily)
VDETLLHKAQRGDRSACEVLLRELADPWFRLCVSLLGDHERAREAVQETAVRFLRNLASFRGASQLRTWSMGIAINVVREMRRARHIPEAGDAAEQSQEHRAGPLELAANAEERLRLGELLHELPQRQREAIVLRFFEGLSVEETAAAMGCASGTVKATVFQALRVLRQRLEQQAEKR